MQDLEVPEPPYAQHESPIHRYYWTERIGALLIFLAAIGVNFFLFIEFSSQPASEITQQRPAVKAAHTQPRLKIVATAIPTPSPELKQNIPHLGIKIMIAPGWILPQITPYPSSTSATVTNAVYNLVLTKNPVATGSPELLTIPSSIEHVPLVIGTFTALKENHIINRSTVPNNYPATSVDEIKYPPDLPIGKYFNGTTFFTQESPTTESLGIFITDIYPHRIHLGISYTLAPDWLPSINNENPDTSNIKRYKVMDMKDEVYKKAVADMDSMVKSIEPLY